ncbi:hypothetical protein HZ326_4652 [Fusarium oxysporum f. sp. albedinis]|nr:hypothetical protein HZ326_4652 [Fusarium oxysporum f. sp. albedinis]
MDRGCYLGRRAICDIQYESVIGPPLTLERQELPASLGKITILAVAVTKNGRKHGDPTEQLDKKSLGDLHTIEFGETSPSRGGRRCLSLCVLRAFSGIYRRRAVSRRRFTVKGGYGKSIAAHSLSPLPLSPVWGRKKKMSGFFFSFMESPPPHVAMQFLSFPRMGAARLSGDQGGRVVTNSLIVESKVSHERKDTGETGGREVFDGGHGVSKRSIDWGNGEIPCRKADRLQ